MRNGIQHLRSLDVTKFIRNILEDSDIYPELEDGLCYGIAVYAALMMCWSSYENYLNLIGWIEFNQSLLVKNLTAYKKGELKDAEPRRLIQEEVNVLALMDGILLLHGFILEGHPNFDKRQGPEGALSHQSDQMLPYKASILIDGVSSGLPIGADNLVVKYFTQEFCNQLFQGIQNSDKRVAYLVSCSRHTITMGGDKTAVYLVNHDDHITLDASASPLDIFTLIYSNLFSIDYVAHDPIPACSVQGISEESKKLLQPYRATMDTVKFNQMSGEYPLLGCALEHGHVGIFRSYIEAFLKSSDLSLQKKIDLLEARETRYFPGHYFSFYNGNAEMVKVYVDAVLQSQFLKPEKKQYLLESKDESGVPCLWIALERGHTEAVKVYVDAVLQSQFLKPKRKQYLLEAKNESGTPGLWVALERGHTEAVKVYVDAVLQSQFLKPKRKQYLLEAKDQSGTPGLWVALEWGHTEAAKVYLEAILKTNDLPFLKKFNLFEWLQCSRQSMDDLYLIVKRYYEDFNIFITIKNMLESYFKTDVRLFDNKKTNAEKRGFVLQLIHSLEQCVDLDALSTQLSKAQADHKKQFNDTEDSRLGSIFKKIQAYMSNGSLQQEGERSSQTHKNYGKASSVGLIPSAKYARYAVLRNMQGFEGNVSGGDLRSQAFL